MLITNICVLITIRKKAELFHTRKALRVVKEAKLVSHHGAIVFVAVKLTVIVTCRRLKNVNIRKFAARLTPLEGGKR
jgi:hypothetical protein